MATVNRYTQLSTPRYSPMSLQELMIAPAYKRQQHDSMSESIANTETQLAQIDPLDIHSDVAKAEQQRLYDQLNKQSELLAREGFNNTSKSDILRLNKDYQTTVGPTGILGKAQLAKQSLNKEKENYIANATKLGYSPEVAGQNWDEHVKQYSDNFKQSGNISTIDSLYAPNYKDPATELKSLLKDAGMSSSDIATIGSNIIFDETKGSYVLTSKARESFGNNTKQLEAAVDYMNNQVLNPNSEVGMSIRHSRKDPDSVLKELSGLDKVYQKDQYAKETGSQISNFNPPKTGDLEVDNGNPNYEYAEASSVKVYNDKIINKLNDIINDKNVTVGGSPTYKSGVSPTGVYFSGQEGIKQEKANIENQLDEQEKRDYDKVYNNIVLNNPNYSNLNKYSKEAVSLVQEYFNNNKEIIRQDIIITDDFIKQYGDRTIGEASTSERNKIETVVQSNPELRKYFIEGSDRALSYDELPSEIKENFKNLTHSGYYSPKNFLTDKYGQVENKELFVSPIKMQYRDDKGEITNILVGRSASERNSPEFKADKDFNNVFVNTNKFPDIPYKLPNNNIEIVYLSKPSMINGKKYSYIINKQLPEGGYDKPSPVTESELQNLFLRAYGAESTTKKKK
jgi:hypothetical protein